MRFLGRKKDPPIQTISEAPHLLRDLELSMHFLHYDLQMLDAWCRRGRKNSLFWPCTVPAPFSEKDSNNKAPSLLRAHRQASRVKHVCSWACFSAEKRCFKVFLVQKCSQSGESETNRFQALNVVVHVFPRNQPRLRHRQCEVLNCWFVSKMFENDVIALVFKCWTPSSTQFPQVEAMSAPFGTEVMWSVRQHKDNVWRN